MPATASLGRQSSQLGPLTEERVGGILKQIEINCSRLASGDRHRLSLDLAASQNDHLAKRFVVCRVYDGKSKTS